PAVAVEDRAVDRERERALAHLLHHEAVGLVGTVKGEDLTAVLSGHDNRVGVSVADCRDGVLGLPEPPTEPLHRGAWRPSLRSLPLRHGPYSTGVRFGCRSRPTSTRCSSDMSPIRRRRGAGSRLTSVGAAMI